MHFLFNQPSFLSYVRFAKRICEHVWYNGHISGWISYRSDMWLHASSSVELGISDTTIHVGFHMQVAKTTTCHVVPISIFCCNTWSQTANIKADRPFTRDTLNAPDY